MSTATRAIAVYRPILATALVALACGGTPPAKSAASDASASGSGSAEGSASASEGPGGATEPGADGSKADAPAAGSEGGSGGQGGSEGDGPKEFKMLDTHTAKDTHGVKATAIKPTKTEAAVKFVVVDQDKGPIAGVVVTLSSEDGKKYYTEETDASGYAELLVPIGKKYEVVYLSLGAKDVAARVMVDNEPNLTMKLTLRYKSRVAAGKTAVGLVLDGVNFDTGKATLRPDSFPRLDTVVEYMTHKKHTRIEISGHTDSVGDKKANKVLSDKRARACREYLISKGIDGARIEAVGYGDEHPMASNDTPEGRQKNRRIEAKEL